MNRLIISAVISLIFLGGCTTVTEAGYYWGDYSSTLYKFTKNPSDETLAAHEEELQEIIKVAFDKGLMVPPGINAELGYINAGRGNDASSKAYYESEMQSYPESRLFLERLIAAGGGGS